MEEDPPGSVGDAIVPRAGAAVWRVGLWSWCLWKECRLLCLPGSRSTNKHQVGLPLHVWVGTVAKLAQREGEVWTNANQILTYAGEGFDQ